MLMGDIGKIGLSISKKDYSQSAAYTLYKAKKETTGPKKAESVNSAVSSQKKTVAKTAANAGAAAILKRQAKSEVKVTTDASGKKVFSGTGSFSAFDSTYTESLKNSRAEKKNTSTAKKKLQYSYKKLSSEIIRSKTPVAAKSAASKARREVIKLRRQKGSGKYDPEEIEAAITHAKSMERIAKKKAAHLEQEEMIEISDDGTNTLSLKDALNEGPTKQERPDKNEDPSINPDTEVENGAASEAQLQKEAMQEAVISEASYDEMAAFREDLAAELSEEMEYMMAELSEEMQEMMEQLDMMEIISGPVGKMTSDDFKMLQTKHRTDEAKAIAKADSEYLKAIFEKYQKEKTAGSSPVASNISSSGAVPLGTATPTASFSSPEGVVVDVSL